MVGGFAGDAIVERKGRGMFGGRGALRTPGAPEI